MTLLVPSKRLRGAASEADDHFGLDGRELAQQKRHAGGDFVFFRRAIFRRAALHHVGDVDVVALQAHGLDHLRQQLSGAADKGNALHVFVVPGPFADEDQLGVRIAHAEDDLVAVAVQLAARAVAQVGGDALERVAFDAVGGFEERRAAGTMSVAARAAFGAAAAQARCGRLAAEDWRGGLISRLASAAWAGFLGELRDEVAAATRSPSAVAIETSGCRGRRNSAATIQVFLWNGREGGGCIGLSEPFVHGRPARPTIADARRRVQSPIEDALGHVEFAHPRQRNLRRRRA